MRQGLGRRRTRVANKIQRILHRYNLMWDYPTKEFQTQTGKRLLEHVALPKMDRFEVNFLMEEWNSIEEQIKQMDVKIVERASRTEPGKVRDRPSLPTNSPATENTPACCCRIFVSFSRKGRRS
jgi:hypothetical protein